MLKKNDAGAPRLPEYTKERQLPKHAWPELRRALREGQRMHLDRDSWFVDDETGKLIAPHPEIERELTDEMLERADLRHGDKGGPDPHVAEAIRRTAGRPRLENPKQSIKLRLDAEVVERFRASGPGWQTRINEALRRALNIGKRVTTAKKRA